MSVTAHRLEQTHQTGGDEFRQNWDFGIVAKSGMGLYYVRTYTRSPFQIVVLAVRSAGFASGVSHLLRMFESYIIPSLLPIDMATYPKLPLQTSEQRQHEQIIRSRLNGDPVGLGLV